MRILHYILVPVALAALPAAASAATVSIFNTGVDSSGSLLGLGAADPHYTVLDSGTPAVTMSSIPGSYIANGPDSLWVWENASGQPTNVTRTFQTTFDLTGFDADTAVLSGEWATDNAGLDILLNGTSTGLTCAGFSSYCSFSITSGFTAGVNTLDFVVQDVGVISGFRTNNLSLTADDDTPTDVPEPAALGLLGLGALGLAAMRRRTVRSA